METCNIIIIIAVSVVFFVLINLINKTPPKGIDRMHFKHEWNDILALVKDPKTRPLSIIKADRLLDEALKCCGYHGETMAERLVAAKNRLKARDRVWQAHKLRNRLVHESLIEPSEKEVRIALNGYMKAFKDLGVF